MKAHQLESREVIERLVLYLQDKKPGYISYKRLTTALERRKTEKPLQQLGTAQQEKYVAELKETLKKAKDADEARALAEFMRAEGKGIQDLFPTGVKGRQDLIPRDQFERGLRKIGYVPQRLAEGPALEKFVEFMLDKKDTRKVNLASLKEQLKTSAVRDPGQAYANLRKMPTRVQAALQSISDHLVQQKIRLADFHKDLDQNKDGVIVMSEWVSVMKKMRVRGVEDSELALIFEHLDVNQDGELSVHEMGLFIQAYEVKKEEARKALEDDREFLRDCHERISDLFNVFDENNDQQVDAGEVMRTLRSFNIYKNEKEC